MIPPMTENTASTINGQVMTTGDSCAWPAASVPGFADECDIEKSEHVKRRQTRHCRAQHEERIIFLFQRLRQNGILRVKSAERRHTAQGQRGEQERPECHRHFLAQPAHLPDVLLVMERDDDRAGAQEQQCLEKCVRGQVKHRSRRATQPNSHDHVAELRKRRVGQDAFDVVLLDGNQRGE